jgi:hypothetical protein
MPDMELETLQRTADAQRQAVEFLNNLLELLKRMTIGLGGTTDGIEAIQEWMLNGGGTLNTILNEEDAGPFGKLLQKSRIPYTAFTFVNGEEQKVAYVYRDKDREQVREILEKDEKVRSDRRCRTGEMEVDR